MMPRWLRRLRVRLLRWRRFPHQSPWSQHRLADMGLAVREQQVRQHSLKAARRERRESAS